MCPHCGHEWAHHRDRCDCGCMWAAPEPPAPPPSPRDPRADMVKRAIFAELGRQHEAGTVTWWAVDDVYCGGIEGEPDWDAVADVVIAALDETKKEPPPPA